jgi:hypothetical protein
MQAGWTVRGTADDVTTCEICGRAELRGTVHLISPDGGEIFAGASCAARKAGTTAAKIRGSVDAAAARAEIIEDAFCSYYRSSFGQHPSVFIGQHGEAGQAGVASVRRQWLRRNGHSA